MSSRRSGLRVTELFNLENRMQITGGRGGVIIKANETEKRALNLTKITTSFIARNLETGGDANDKALHDAAAKACEAVALVEQLLAKRNEVAPAEGGKA